MLNRLYARLQAKFIARRQYRKLVAEIETLSQADLMELGAFEIDLYRAARKEVFG